ncbi:hypothetical protein ACHAWO_008623 [Cyclotella atomus]|uniref:Fe2OG dioxygenase domain-containing protein n=1 Tax=Cyclotella atomus TaxID=382360 RepID=A0ABD3MYQ2_9STRA
MNIPIIDISPLHSLTIADDHSSSPSSPAALQKCIADLKSACQSHGFFAIQNHGIPSSLITAVRHASRDFFDSSPDIKREVTMSEDYPYGYENYESLGVMYCSNGSGGDGNDSSSNDSSANRQQVSTMIDSKETFSIGPSHNSSKMPPRQFPSHPSSFQRALTEYYTAMETLACTLFRGLALALDLKMDWFLQRDVFDVTAHQCALRVLNYPPLEYYEDADAAGDETKNKTVIRAGAHTDYGALTILLSGGPGLQLCLDPNQETNANNDTITSNTNTTTWMDVPHLEGAFIINLGDLMQRWTNDRWRSTLHRVVAVPDDIACDDEGHSNNERRLIRCSRRQSIAFFVNMNGDANIVPFESCVDEKSNPARYEAIKASDHLMQRHLRSMGKQT